jgi:hypothetical protein
VARARKVDPTRVVWHAPETLGQAELAEKLAAAGSAEDALNILNSRPTVGEYRVQEEALAVQDGPDGTTVLGPVWGDRAVWVPDGDDGSFEVYDAERHGDDYKPIFRPEA